MRLAAVSALAVMALGRTVACSGPPKPAPPRPAPTAASVSSGREALVSADRAWSYLRAQVDMGPRAHGMPGHARLDAFLQEHLERCGATVSVMNFSYTPPGGGAEEFRNVIGRFNPQAERWILLGTHHDTRLWGDVDADPAQHERPIEGANDGGSGTAVLLEIASVLKDRPPDIGVAIVFFDGEDFGRAGTGDYFLGSRAMAARWTEVFGAARPESALVLDMVGDANLHFVRETKAESATPWLNDHIWAAGGRIAPRAFGKAGSRPVYDDHDALMALGIPATLLIDFDYPHWHTSHDTLDKCSRDSLADVARVVLASMVDAPPAVPPLSPVSP